MFKTETIRRLTGPIAWAGGFSAGETLGGNVTLTKKSARIRSMDPNNGPGRDVTLHAVSVDDAGDFYLIVNIADAAEPLTIKNAGGSTVGTVAQAKAGLFFVNDAGAWALFTYLSA